MTQPDLMTYFQADHGRCDTAWTELEANVTSGPSAQTRALWEAFAAALQENLSHEEDVLFPRFERATGMVGEGPTEVMRSEHHQMRMILRQMSQAAEGSDWESVLDHGDTLLMLIQQHNAKEEGCLFPMAERAVGAQWAEMLAELEGRG